MKSYIERVQSAIKDLQEGKLIILTDDPNRENEGDLIFPAETITPEIMNFIIRHSSGIVCLSLLEDQLKRLHLPLMVPAYENTSQRNTPFTISIDAKENITTGVSAHDRVKTVQVAMNSSAKPDELVKPGHIFPLRAKKNGVLERAGHTEGAIDIVNLAGFKPAAVLCEIMNSDGTMAHGKQLQTFANEHHLSILSIEDIISYRLSNENLIEEEVSALLPIESLGPFTMTVIKEKVSGDEHIILENKNVQSNGPLLVRIHSACITGDIFSSLRCDCHSQLHYALDRISKEGGMLIYLSQEGRGVGLFNKIKAYALQEKGLDTVEANEQLGLPIDSRKYYIAANVLRNKHIQSIRLLTNNPSKVHDLEKYGMVDITMDIMPVFCQKQNENYLKVKKHKLNHCINHDF
jgi:3,4-dihydroxy 2-butanone 4-phosphate synthase / GTP cyclohydrolase II